MFGSENSFKQLFCFFFKSCYTSAWRYRKDFQSNYHISHNVKIPWTGNRFFGSVEQALDKTLLKLDLLKFYAVSEAHFCSLMVTFPFEVRLFRDWYHRTIDQVLKERLISCSNNVECCKGNLINRYNEKPWLT